MLLIISLIIVSLFIYFLKDSLKKHAGIYYIGAAVISIAVFLIGFLPMPLFLKNNILGIFAKGSLGTAMFIAVMYAGALPKGSKLIVPLMKIRGELSITAAILVLCHNFTYGITYFKMLFIKPEALPATQLTAAIISLVLHTKNKLVEWKKAVPAVLWGTAAVIISAWLANRIEQSLLSKTFGIFLILMGLKELFFKSEKHKFKGV